MKHWQLKNKNLRISVSDHLHLQCLQSVNITTGELAKPNEFGQLPNGCDAMSISLLRHLREIEGIVPTREFDEGLLKIMEQKCTKSPSYLFEYRLALDLYHFSAQELNALEIWEFLMFGEPEADRPTSNYALLQSREFVFREIFTYCVSIGGGFSSFGTMDNYRGFTGGRYTNPKSYRHYIPKHHIA